MSVKEQKIKLESDPISRQAAIEALTGWQTDPTDEEIARTLKELPPVEPDRPKGGWVPNHDGSWNCSECGLRVLVYAKGNYCPNCGSYNGGKK